MSAEEDRLIEEFFAKWYVSEQHQYPKTEKLIEKQKAETRLYFEDVPDRIPEQIAALETTVMLSGAVNEVAQRCAGYDD